MVNKKNTQESQKKRTLTFFINVLFAILIFVIPSNLFLKFFVDQAYIKGLLVDYLIPKLYLSDLVIFVVIMTTLIARTSDLKIFIITHFNWLKWLIAFFAIIVFGQFFVEKPIAAFFQLIKIVEFIFLAIALLINKKTFNIKMMVYALAITIIFQTSLAIFQFSTQHQLIGFPFFGEPNYENSFVLSRANIFGAYRILAYGTTTHPNVLAGTITIYALLALHLLKKTKTNHPAIFYLIVFSCLLITLSLTLSLSATMSFVLGMLVIFSANLLLGSKIKKKHLLITILAVTCLAPIMISFFTKQNTKNPSLVRRNLLNQAAFAMTIDQPILGQGINQFTVKLEKYGSTQEIVRFVQPAHHTFLLLLSEWGIIGLFCLVLTALKLNKAQLYWLIVLLPVLSLDHYLYTQQTGLGLVCLVLALADLKKSQYPKKLTFNKYV